MPMLCRSVAAAVLVLLAGCASPYDPPLAGDHAAVRYQTDLQRCNKQAQTAADRVANATPTSAVSAVFASDQPRRAAVQACMVSRGYRTAG
jgi:hypothetical protein